MKSSKAAIHHKAHAQPELRFEEQQLTSFSGLIIVQQLFARLDLKQRLRRCFDHLEGAPIYGHGRITLLLIVHVLLGFRELRHLRYYDDDPLVKRVLGLSQLPNVATVSRALASADGESAERLRSLSRELVLQRIGTLRLARITLDFDGSVIGTGRCAEGTAIGFNPRRKGQRSYYPLFCTVAQTGQVLDVLHRSGNVHDANGAETFILACIAQARTVLPDALVEVRMDAAFFSDAIIGALEAAHVRYTISVPFERFSRLKDAIEGRCRWHRLDTQCDYFERAWKPKSWHRRRRFIFVRTRVKRQHKAPVQLDLFVPRQEGYDFKVMITNHPLTARKILRLHNGRGAQEGIFAELKSDNQMDYVPTRTWLGNQIYLLAVLMAHNLARELHMLAHPATRRTQEKRPALWNFTGLDTLRRRVIQRAGRLIRPQGRLTLSMSANPVVKNQLLQYLDAVA